MGMTIDYCVNELLLNKEDDTYVLTNETTDFAINVMRKYQKITEIVTKWHNDLSFKTSMAMTEIEEVIEDGKID